MKKVIFGFIATAAITTVSFANNASLKKEIEVKNEIQTVVTTDEKKKDETVCTVTCTAVMADGTVYTATAGNWLTSCTSAETKCKAKLFDQIMGIN